MLCVNQSIQQIFPDRTCPARSIKDSSGSCQCENSNEIFDQNHWICCPNDSSPDGNTCVCHKQNDFFDHFHGLCISKLYLPSTTTPVPIPYNYTPYVPVPCTNDPSRFQPFCFEFKFNITACEPGKVGTYPYCHDPCPPNQSRKVFLSLIFFFLEDHNRKEI